MNRFTNDLLLARRGSFNALIRGMVSFTFSEVVANVFAHQLAVTSVV